MGQPDYLDENKCNNVYKMHMNVNIDDTRYFVWSISV